MELKHKNNLGFRRIAREWSIEPGTLTYAEILTELLMAYWKGEFVGEDAPDRAETMAILKYCDAIPYEYRDDENPPKDDYEFLAELPPDGYDETSVECYGKVAWSILNGVEIPKQVLADWCDAKGFPKPTFWFGKFTKPPGTAKALADCSRWLREEVKKGKSRSKDDYWLDAKKKFSNLSRRGFSDAWRETVPESWKRSGRRVESARSTDPSKLLITKQK